MREADDSARERRVALPYSSRLAVYAPSPVGLASRRRAGHPYRLTEFDRADPWNLDLGRLLATAIRSRFSGSPGLCLMTVVEKAFSWLRSWHRSWG